VLRKELAEVIVFEPFCDRPQRGVLEKFGHWTRGASPAKSGLQVSRGLHHSRRGETVRTHTGWAAVQVLTIDSA